MELGLRDRVAVVTARPRILPALIWGMAVAAVANTICTSPPSSAVIAGAPPL